jgi:amino acid transporter
LQLKYILKKPVYFAICVFGITFILLANVATNSIAFGLSILDAADLSGINNHDEIVRGIAIGMAAFSCLIHGFWRQGGLYLNNLLALIKILILLMIFILGMIAVSGKVFPKPAGAPAALYDSSLASSFNGKNADAYGYAEAFLSILFAFGGFNQANYVMGEVDDPRRRYKWPAFFAVVIVSTLYLLVNIAYFVVVPAEDFNETAITSNVAHKFFDLTLGSLSSSWAPKASRILSGFMAISSFGNIIVMTYTAARVKQEIAKEGILPFRRMLANSKRSIVIPVRKLWKSKYETLPEEVPVGALILHFTMSILLILGTWPLTTPDTYSLLVDLYSYSIDATFGVCVGFGLLFLRLLPKRGWAEHSQNSGFRINPYVSFFAAAIFGIANLFPIVAKWIPPKVAVASAVPWYTTGVVGWSILLCGFFWWVGFRFFVPHIGRDHVGRYLLVTRKLWFHQENDYKVLEYEDIDFRWPPRSKEKETTLQEEVIVAKDSEVRARLQRDETRGRYL